MKVLYKASKQHHQSRHTINPYKTPPSIQTLYRTQQSHEVTRTQVRCSRLGDNSDNKRSVPRLNEGPVHEREADAVGGAGAAVVEHLPRHRLPVGRRPAHARRARPALDARVPLLRDAGHQVRAQEALPPLVAVQHLVHGDLPERRQRRLQHVQPGLVRERQHRHRLQHNHDTVGSKPVETRIEASGDRPRQYSMC